MLIAELTRIEPGTLVILGAVAHVVAKNDGVSLYLTSPEGEEISLGYSEAKRIGIRDLLGRAYR